MGVVFLKSLVCVRACVRACVRVCVVLLLLLFTITDRVGSFNYGVYIYEPSLEMVGDTIFTTTITTKSFSAETERESSFNYGVYTYTQLLQKLVGGKADAAVFREVVRWTQA